MTHVAVLIPGIMGSVLKLGDEVIWPGSVLEILLPYKKMEQLLDPNLVATDVVRSVSISEYYQKLIRDLGKCGFREDDDPKTLYAFAYDWRKDNRLAAQRLADLADQIAGTGATTISVIAHSMGGLVARYFLESGDFNSRRGFSLVRILITLGTPHRGTPLALSAARGEEKRLFLNADQVKRLVNDPDYPALYQLMPPPGEPFAWNEDKGAEFRAVDIYNGTLAQALGLNLQNLKVAEEFFKKFDVAKRPQFNGQPIRYFFFVGTRLTTISSVNVLKVDASKYNIRKTELEDAGDGTVPAWSAAITGIQGQPVGGDHVRIYRNDILRRTMAALLGAPGVLAAGPMQVEVALRERVVHPADNVHASLTFGAVVDKLDGKLIIQLVDATTSPPKYSKPVSVFPIKYTGLNAERLSVIFSAPGLHGIYRVGYFPDGYDEDEPAGFDDLIVQQK